MSKTFTINYSKKTNISNLLFFTALFLYCIYFMIANITLYYEMPGIIGSSRKILKYLIFAIVFAKIFFTKKYKVHTLLYMMLFIFLVLIEYVTGGYSGLFLSIGLIFCASDIDFEKICKFVFANILGWGITVPLLSMLGFLNDYTYNHNIGNKVVTAHSLGFLAYNHLGFMVMAASLLWIYIRKECSYFELLIVASLNYFLYTIHTTRLTIIVVFLYIILYIIFVKNKLFQNFKKALNIIATLMPAGIFGGLMILLWLYMDGRIVNAIPSLSTTMARLKYSAYYLELYGLRLFGTKVEMNSIQEYFYGTNNVADHIYIDCGYIYSLIAYGIIFSLIITISYTIMFRYLLKTNNWNGYLWIFTIMIACIINNFLLNIIFNPLLFLLPSALNKNKGNIASIYQSKNERVSDG